MADSIERIADEMLSYKDLTPEQRGWATRLRALSPAGVSKECDRQLALYRKFVNDLDDSTEYARAVITRPELRKMFADLTAALQDGQRNVE